MIYRAVVMSAILLAGAPLALPADGQVGDVQAVVINGTCSSSSQTAEGPLDSDLTKRQSRFYCDSAAIMFFDDYPGHILIDFSQKEAKHSPILGFAGRIAEPQTGDSGIMMQVYTAYLGTEEATTVSDGSCKFFYKDKQLSGIGCEMNVDETGRRTFAGVAFDAAPGQTVLFSAQPQQADPGFQTYKNSRYGFRVDYPESFVPQQPPENGDGLGFKSPDGKATLDVAGGNNDAGLTLKEEFDSAIKDVHGQLGYHKIGGSWFVVTWTDGSNVGYIKEFVGPGSYNSLSITYPVEQSTQYDSVVTTIEKSFKPGNVGNSH